MELDTPDPKGGAVQSDHHMENQVNDSDSSKTKYKASSPLGSVVHTHHAAQLTSNEGRGRRAESSLPRDQIHRNSGNKQPYHPSRRHSGASSNSSSADRYHKTRHQPDASIVLLFTTFRESLDQLVSPISRDAPFRCDMGVLKL